jgi:oxygen-independent coproporphyrinogen-3 oxidase
VGREGVRGILREYVERDAGAFGRVDYGCRLDAGEQRRRYVLKSILRREGMTHAGYRERFGTEAAADVPELAGLVAAGFLTDTGEGLRPTERGLDYSDAIGPALFSEAVKKTMEAFELH